MKLGRPPAPSPIAASALLALGLFSCGGGAPDPIAAEMAKTPRGQVTVVEFLDYRCRFCRAQGAVLADVLSRHDGEVRFVVKHVPLDKHPGARRAAAAAVCAEGQGKLAAVHEALLEAPETSEETLIAIAQRAGLEVERFRECTKAPETEDRIQRDIEDFDLAGGSGLPMIFVGSTRFVGLTDVEPLEKAMKDEVERAP